jgi:hypothetical protein
MITKLYRATTPGTVMRKFLSKIYARGGTELARAPTAAAKILAKEGGDVLMMTEGQVFGTATVIQEARAAGIGI